MALTDDRLGRIAGIWAFAEAIVWFILPDFFVLPAVVARPNAFGLITRRAIIGTTVGSLAMAGLTLANPGVLREVLEALPFTHPSMFGEVASRVGDVGQVMSQPISGIPAKVWTWTQVTSGTLGFVLFLVAMVAARTVRFVVVGLVGLGLERVAGRQLRSWWLVVLPLYTGLFLVALSATTGV